MESQSFDSILNSIKERKKFERESSKKFAEQKCSVCKNNIVKNGVSQYAGVCKNCVSDSIKAKGL